MTRQVGLLLLFASIAGGCAAPQPPGPAKPPDTRAAEEAALRAVIKNWAAAAQAKDAATFASFYASNATVLMEGAPDVIGPPAELQKALGA